MSILECEKDGGGGGSANRGAVLRQSTDSGKGLFISHPEATPAWHLRGVERSLASGGTPATAEYRAGDQSNKLTLTWPSNYRYQETLIQPEDINAASISHIQYPKPVAEVKAFADYFGVRVSSKRDGTEGNGETLTFNYGHPDTASVQSYARIPFKRGLTADDGEFLQITSPGGGTAASGSSQFQSNRRINYAYHQEGESGNDFRILYRLSKASSGGGTVTAEYDSETQLTITISFPSGSTGLAYSFNISDIVTAVNAARWSNARLVSASLGSADGLVGFVASRNPSVGDSLTPTNPSAARAGVTLSGGIGYIGLSSNIGEVRVSKTGARVAGAKAKATLDVNPDSAVNGIVITAKEEGAALNSTPIGIRFQSVAVPANSVAIIGQSGRLQLAVNGTVTMQAIVDKVNAAVANTFASQFTASLASGQSGSTQVTWSSGDSSITVNTAGGADSVNPLEAIWDDDNHRLVIRAIDTDTLSDVRAKILELDEFDSTDFALVRALTTDTIELPSAIGQFADYAFANGADATHRSVISFSESSTALVVNGVVSGDTAKDVIDRAALASLEFFTLAVRPNFQETSAFSTFSDSTINFANGVDAVERKLPVIAVSRSGRTMSYAVSYHGTQTASAQRTTLNEMKSAWDGLGGINTAILGDGARRITRVPPAATGGSNPDVAGDITAEVKPDDEVNGPNVEVRYHADHDTLQEILDALIEQGEVDVVEIYGTDLSEEPEEPPFTRAMYPQAGAGGITAINHDATLSGSNTGTDPLRVTNPFTDADETKLDGIEAGAEVNPTDAEIGDAAFSNPPSDLTNPEKKAARDAIGAGTGSGDGSGLSDVSTDSTITGDGTSGDPLKVANPFTDADETKLDGIEAGAEVNVQADWNQSTSSDDSFIKHKPTLGTASAKDVGTGSGDVPVLDSSGDIPDSMIPAAIARDTEVTAAIEALKGGAPTGLDTLKELADAIGLRINYRGDFGSTDTYVARDAVRHTAPAEAHYIAIRNVPAGKTPGVASDWKSYWYRLGFAEGPPNAFIGASLSDLVLTLTRESGTNPLEIILPGLSSGESRIEQINMQNVPNGMTDVELTPVNSNPLSVVFGAGENEILSDISGNDFKLAAGVYLVDVNFEGSANSNANSRIASAQFHIHAADGDTLLPGGITTSPKFAGTWMPMSALAVIYVKTETLINIQVHRAGGNTMYRNVEIEFVRWGGLKGDKGDKGDPGPAGAGLEVVGSANFDLDARTNSHEPGVWKTQVAGQTPIDVSDIKATDIIAVRANVPTWDDELHFTLGSEIVAATAGQRPSPGEGSITISSQTSNATLRLFLGKSGGKLLLTQDGPSAFIDPAPFVLYKFSSGEAGGPSTDPNLTSRPHISAFALTSGNLSPVAGSIGTLVYGYSFTIAQSSHVGSARIIGFKGTAAIPTSVAVLDNISAGLYHGGTGDVVIPSGVSLAAGETYTVRLEVYGENQDAATELPVSYQDIRITAHASATAAYHVGYVQYDSDDSGVADTLARITDFSGDTATAAALPASMEIDVPDDSNSYQLYLAAKASETQPTGFTSAGLPATGSFYGAQSKTISGVDYKFYILRPTWRVTSADNGDTFGVTS